MQNGTANHSGTKSCGKVVHRGQLIRAVARRPVPSDAGERILLLQPLAVGGTFLFLRKKAFDETYPGYLVALSSAVLG